jgi:NAD(P)-dependent dehydrogenase (short-subunit alcohol dehydrogenase family)
VYETRTLQEFTRESALKEYTINALGPILVSRALLPNLRASSGPHVVNMTSRMGSIDDNTSGGSYGYRASKTALNQMTKSFAIDCPDVRVIAVHPGYIQTDMTSGRGETSPQACAQELVKLFDEFLQSKDKIKSGSFLHRNGSVLPY